MTSTARYVVPVERLQALACAVALDEDVDVVVGPPGSGWFIHSETLRINADESDLLEQTDADVLGLVCHEAAHAAVTRYTQLIPGPILRRPGIASLMNSLEDCRIEDWLRARYPGSRAWIQRYNDRLFPREAPMLGELPWFQQFNLGAIHAWWYGELPATLHPAAREALEQTRAAREGVVAAQPPHDAVLDVGQAMAYVAHPVAEVYRRSDAWMPPDPFERLVRMSAYEAYRITWTEIRPVYLQLIADDVDNRDRMRELERAFLRDSVREMRNGPPVKGSGRRGGAESDRLPGLDRDARTALDAVARAEAEHAYEAARREVARLADGLVDALDRVLRPASYPRWLTGHPSGSRVDLRAAMTVDVRPGGYARMWERKTLPHKRDPAFTLLVDLSGSMQEDGRILQAFRGAVLMAEVLGRMQVPFAVYGFQDVPIPFKRFDEPFDGVVRGRMGTLSAEVEGTRRGGHNQPAHNWDGPVLEAVAREALAWPAQQRFLIVLSDGAPSGPGSVQEGERALRRAVEGVLGSGLHLIGVGIGPGTDHVARFYPDALANIPLDQLPRALGNLIDRMLVGYGPARTSR